MSNITLILVDKYWIYIIAILIGIFLTIIFNKKRITTSVLILNWAPVLGLAVLIYIAAFSDTLYSMEILLLSIAIESLLLFVITCLLRDLLGKIKHDILEYSSSDILIKLFFVSNLVTLFLIVSNPTSLGIFSSGSRIDYLSNGTLPLLLTYLSMVIQPAIMLSIASRIYIKKFSKLDVITILFTLITSLLSGSKGAVFLSVAYMIFIAWGMGYNFSRLFKIMVPLIGLPLVGLYTFVLSHFLNTTFLENIGMALSRFVLSADGRALASDYQIREALMGNIHGSLLSEIFKGFAPRLGYVVSDIPLGVAQYAAAYNISSYVGANAGISSTIMSYYKSPIDLLSIFICLLFTLIVVVVGYITVYISRTHFQRFMTIAFIVTLLLTLVQDYQAFVLTAALMFLWVAYVLLRRMLSVVSKNISNTDCKSFMRQSSCG